MNASTNKLLFLWFLFVSSSAFAGKNETNTELIVCVFIIALAIFVCMGAGFLFEKRQTQKEDN